MSLVQIAGGQAVVGVVGPLDRPRRRPLNGSTLTTGPKISSRAMAMSSLTLSKIVGSTKKPLVADALAAGDELGPLLLAEVDVAEDLVELLLRDLRALLGRRVERVAELAALGLLGQPLDELLVDLLLDEQPAAGRAALAAVEVDGVEGAGDGLRPGRRRRR